MAAHLATPASPEAIFRLQVVSQVLAQLRCGVARADAIADVTSRPHLTLEGDLRLVSARTLYRWLKAHGEAGFAGLEPVPRSRCTASTVLPAPFLTFVQEQRGLDPKASIPELIRRARALGIVARDLRLDRVTVWRAMRRMGMDTRRRKVSRQRDARRWAWPHRMQMLLTDGKHFRAGASRLKRVALFFLDDASRYGLHVVVGASENTALYLRGLYETITRHGLMDGVYLDRGPGFRSHDTGNTIGKLDALWILGEAGYPEGHGKIEKFNQTAQNSVLRFLDGNPAVDPACGALELRLQHYLRQVYNLDPHEGIDGKPPQERWVSDTRALRFPDNDATLRQKFVLHEERTVSADNVVAIDGVDFEMPRGHATDKVIIHRQLLDCTVAVLHDGNLVELHPVDLAANAAARRARPDQAVDTTHPLPPSAAEIEFNQDFGSVLGPDGGFTDNED